MSVMQDSFTGLEDENDLLNYQNIVVFSDSDLIN